MDNYEKKYKEALEWARKVMQGKIGFVLDDVLEKFPELKESEDERIRKALIDYFKTYKEQEECGIKTFFGIPTDNILAWLEKQGEQDDYDDNIITRDDEILQAISIGLTDAEKDLERHDFGGLPIEEIQRWLDKQSRPLRLRRIKKEIVL